MPIPNSLPWMESVDAKMIRAHEHLKNFANEVDGYLSTIRLQMYLRSSPIERYPRLVVHANERIPPIRLSAMAGDCVHNMRSALDNLVCALALTLDHGCSCANIAFPVVKDGAGWNEKAEYYLKGIPADAKEAIKSLQPWLDQTTPHPLLILNNLSNLDKHRYCAFALTHSRDTVFRVHCRDGFAVDVWPKEDVFLGEAKSFVVPVSPALIGQETRVQAKGTFVLNFRDEGPWGDLHVTNVLHRCFDYVESTVIARLKRFFEASTAAH